MTSRKTLDDLLADANEQNEILGAMRWQFEVYTPGDTRGTRYRLVREDTNRDLSRYMSGKELEMTLRTIINIQAALVTMKRGR